MKVLKLALIVCACAVSLQAVAAAAPEPIRSDGQNLWLKSILEKVGNQLRAIVIDRQGHERRLLLTADDCVEVKRGLWVVRAGNYTPDI